MDEYIFHINQYPTSWTLYMVVFFSKKQRDQNKSNYRVELIAYNTMVYDENNDRTFHENVKAVITLFLPLPLLLPFFYELNFFCIDRKGNNDVVMAK